MLYSRDSSMRMAVIDRKRKRMVAMLLLGRGLRARREHPDPHVIFAELALGCLPKGIYLLLLNQLKGTFVSSTDSTLRTSRLRTGE